MQRFIISCRFLFFFNDTATTEIYTLSLHDALPIYFPQELELGKVAYQYLNMSEGEQSAAGRWAAGASYDGRGEIEYVADRKSTRLNSSHANISYAVFCLKKKK